MPTPPQLNRPPSTGVFLVTGTDTGVGKTVLTALLVRRLRARGVPCLAVKPVGSGGRGDARVLLEAQGNPVPLDAVNPWHFPLALTPCMAARRAGRPLPWSEVRPFLRSLRQRDRILLVEGAGGLLSPLGEDFDNRTMLRELRAIPVVAVANRLGCLNHALLTWEALGPARRRARVVLMNPARPDAVSRSNLECLEERLGGDRVMALPWLPRGGEAPLTPRLGRVLDQVLGFA